MKTSKSIPPSSSAEPRVLQLQMPRSWAELTDRQLRYVYVILCLFDADLAQLYIFLRLAEEQLHERGWWVGISKEELASAATVLDWIHEVPDVPVRLSAVEGHDAVHALLRGVTFETYLSLENLFQGFIQSRDEAALDEMLPLLYPGTAKAASRPYLRYNIIQWMTSLKKCFSSQWREFFRPVHDTPSEVSMLDVMNAEIRALTGGDVTKISQVMQTDCWHALTELDAKAREAREMKELLNRK